MKKTDIILKNEQSLVLKIATITTNMLAKYIYEGIKKLDCESLAKYEDLAGFQSHEEDIDVYEVLEDIEAYQNDVIDSLETDIFCENIITNFYGKNHEYEAVHFDTEEELNEFLLEEDLFIINDSLIINDVSDDLDACSQVLEMLEADKNDNDE
ncbi:hypothetical protein IEC87_003930 [Salmonella enterica subsp. enterica serovar Infantis]|nr:MULTISPECIES: hypothetical protein [Enterobacteriaceae]EAA8182074.1 hypothetical protein [Salmonella enterica subsp. enterica serovar Infantis]EAO3410601.1 hypothetical protein [Salmonella enterica]EBS2638929.1 hypothetical protein [Salmonella enterica subsp. enterica serovar Agona]EBV3102544.1 hypothetical protein [Salmonella enterica subsp. enterica serovar Corvallis]ECO1424737.1 hypothetical protein [Salmonella enterica subsp. enterica serovar Senftenberg]ECT9048459.1 hypothetical prote